MLKLLLDENIGKKTADFLLKLGYDIKLVAKDFKGAKDKDILKVAFQEKRIILTQDKDFCDLVFRDSLPCCGIILLRLNSYFLEAVNKILDLFLKSNKENLQNKFVVLTENSARIREI